MLYNQLSREEAWEKLKKENEERVTISFYRYVRIEDPEKMRDTLFFQWHPLGVLGRIYVAKEGINAQLCVPKKNLDAFRESVWMHNEFKKMYFNIAVEEKDSFIKLMIKVKKQIVADGLEDDSYDLSDRGTYLDAKGFNEALEDPNTIAVDMRNHYESRIGTFEGSYCPDADTFREELPMVVEELKDKKDKKVVMFCTGGIRCEKASAYLKSQGFEDVYHLKGGIITYAHEVKEKSLESKFRGRNFVFDERTDERITEDILSTCDQCDEASDTYVNCKNVMCNLLFIQCEKCKKEMDTCCSKECQKIANLSSEEQKKLRKEQISSNQKKYSKSIRPKVKLSKVA